MPDKADIDRSAIMRAVKGKDTKPEMIVRRLLHQSGYRYRLHCKDLPGKPDIVFRGRRKVLFVHGCFWHGHDCKRGLRQPKNNADYWKNKITRNVVRDQEALSQLQYFGWRTLVLWECELKDDVALLNRVRRFLG